MKRKEAEYEISIAGGVCVLIKLKYQQKIMAIFLSAHLKFMSSTSAVIFNFCQILFIQYVVVTLTISQALI